MIRRSCKLYHFIPASDRTAKSLQVLINFDCSTMKAVVAFTAVLLTVVAAQEYYLQPESDSYPTWYIPSDLQARQRRDVTWDKKVGQDGKVFGTLGQNDNGLFGKAGYQHNVFDDHRGKLDASAYGSHVLGPYGDSSHVGGGLDWKGAHSAASLGASRQIGGHSSIDASAGGRWPVGKNGDITAQGTFNQFAGRRDYGGRADFNYRW